MKKSTNKVIINAIKYTLHLTVAVATGYSIRQCDNRLKSKEATGKEKATALISCFGLGVVNGLNIQQGGDTFVDLYRSIEEAKEERKQEKENAKLPFPVEEKIDDPEEVYNDFEAGLHDRRSINRA